jgi:hypothetical protein
MHEINVLGLLAARGGSKGIPGKNIRPLCGRPLLAWAAQSIIQAPSINRSICSTDDESIALAARECGLEVPFIRPDILATDTASIVDVIQHALDSVDSVTEPFTHILLVQATTPTVTTQDVEEAIALLHNKKTDTVITGFPSKANHPALMFTLDDNSEVSWLLDNNNYTKRRQDFPEVFVRTGLLYLVSAKVLKERNTIYGDHIHTLIVDENRAFTIDEEADFLRAEYLMSNKAK